MASDEFSFKPQINRVSAVLASKRRSTATPVYEALVQEAVHRERRIQQMNEERQAAELAECTFKPHLEAPERLAPEQVEILTRRLAVQPGSRTPHAQAAAATE